MRFFLPWLKHKEYNVRMLATPKVLNLNSPRDILVGDCCLSLMVTRLHKLSMMSYNNINNPFISTRALSVLITFGSNYLCKAAFSTQVVIKTKHGNKLCALSGIKLRTKELVAMKQCQESH